MGTLEPKSGKLYKFGHGLFGPKWTEKWVHLDHHVLKYFSMASEQAPRFSLSSARQSYSIELAGYDFVLQEDKRFTRKHAFHLLPKNKTSKAYVFACGNDKELYEWQEAFQARSSTAGSSDTSPVVVEKLRRASDAFTTLPSITRVFCALYVDWQGDISEYSLIQQQLDPNVEGKISREQFLRIMKHYFTVRNNRVPVAVEKVKDSQKEDTAAPRSSFSDHPRHTKHSQLSEPEAVSEMDVDEEFHQLNNPPAPISDPRTSQVVITPSMHDDTKAREWQSEFCRVQVENSDDDSVPQGLKMAAFLAAFQLAAETAMVDIVYEIAVDDDARTIPFMALDDDQFLATDYAETNEALRLSIRKFVVNGLLIYITHDETVHKVFGHQLRAARAIQTAIMETNATSLHVPLQCVVDYLGFRGLVLAQPPHHTTRILSSRMLLSCDRTHQAIFLKQLEMVCKQLGLYVDDCGQGRDGYQDRLPPFVGAAAGISTTLESGRVVAYLHNLFDCVPTGISAQEASLSTLRPELVGQLGESLPLHPQHGASSFSDEQRVILKQAVLTAEEHLQYAIIPAFVNAIETQSAHIYDSCTLTEALHGEGINARYLGLCYEVATSNHVKKLLLSEMMGRAVKNELRVSLQSVFRDAVSDAKQVLQNAQRVDEVDRILDSPVGSAVDVFGNSGLHALSREIVEDNSMQLVHEFFNLVFGHGANDAKSFWHDRILSRVQQQFVFSNPGFMSELSGNTGTPLEELVHWPQLLQSVLHHTIIHLIDDVATINFFSSRPFPNPESFSLTPHSRLLCETTYACQQLAIQANTWIATGQIEHAMENVKAQIAIVDSGVRGDTSPALGNLLISAADLSLLLGQIEEAEKFVLLALEANTAKSVNYARSLLMKIRVTHAQSHPLEEIHPLFCEAVTTVNDCFGGVHPMVFDLYTTMIAISRDYGDHEGIFQLFQDVAVLAKEHYGKVSVAYAELRRLEGDALVEGKRLEDAASVFDEAYSVYERLAQENASDPETTQEIQRHAAQCLYMIALIQASKASSTGLEVAFSTAVRALSLRQDILPPAHADIVQSRLHLGELCVALGDYYRALEYYRPALVHLKASASDEASVQQLRTISQAVLNAHIRLLPAEKLAIVEKTKKRFVNVIGSLETALTATADMLSASVDQPSTSIELELIHTLTHKLLEKDPVDLLDQLLHQVDDEWRSLRRERLANGTTTIGVEAVAEDPTSPARPPVAPSRFASFAIGQLSHPPTSPPPNATTTSSEPLALVVTPTGEFTYGSQLAALLFLASLPDE